MQQPGIRLRVWGLRFRVWGLVFRVWGLGYGVQGLGGLGFCAVWPFKGPAISRTPRTQWHSSPLQKSYPGHLSEEDKT